MARTETYPSPSSVTQPQNDRQKQLATNRKKAKVAEYNKDIAKVEDKVKKKQKEIETLEKEGLKYWTNIYKTTTDPGMLVEADEMIKGIKKEIVKLNAEIYTLNEEIRILKIQRDAIFAKPKPKPKPDSKKDDKPAVTVDKGGNVQFSTDYKYNAPMVSSAYFNKGIAASTFVEDSNFPINAPMFTDAYNAWRGITGGRGTIQMDRKYVNNIAKSQGDDTTALDPQMYGFKFLYNPTTVSMGWGVQMDMDPPYESSGADTFNPIASNLISSTIVFEVLLNRIADFNHLQPNGELIGEYPYGEFDVPKEELQQIYERGTMYDLEYFFKTINGPHATFTSSYNGLTADKGWLLPSSMELHLGASMRYRIRINQVSVNHIIFNDRMVPILSKVQFTCGRYNDGPGKPLVTRGGSGGGNARVNSVVL
jgi:hypothetical protein